jgi:hypothetical protein
MWMLRETKETHGSRNKEGDRVGDQERLRGLANVELHANCVRRQKYHGIGQNWKDCQGG